MYIYIQIINKYIYIYIIYIPNVYDKIPSQQGSVSWSSLLVAMLFARSSTATLVSAAVPVPSLLRVPLVRDMEISAKTQTMQMLI